MSSNEKAPQKVWLEYYPDEHFLYLTDELVWTGCMTEYVRSDYYDRLREALRAMLEQYDEVDLAEREPRAMTEAAIQARALLQELDNLEPKP